MPNTFFDGAAINEVVFQSSDLYRNRFVGANLRYTSFQDSNLVEANFSSAILKETDFSGSPMRFANFASFSGDLELNHSQKAEVLNLNEYRSELDARGITLR